MNIESTVKQIEAIDHLTYEGDDLRRLSNRVEAVMCARVNATARDGMPPLMRHRAVDWLAEGHVDV